MTGIFKFKKFHIAHDKSSIRVGTDAILLGAWADIESASSILDIGTGCGIIAIMSAQRSKATITGIDIDEMSIIQAKENAGASAWSDRLNFIKVSLQNFSKEGKKFDHILSNPPFFENSLKSPNSKNNMSKHNVNLNFEELVSLSAKMLLPQGHLSVIIPADSEERFIRIADINNLFLQRCCKIYPHPSKKSKRVLHTYGFNIHTLEKNSLYIMNLNNSYTDEYKKITGDFYL